MAKSKQKTPSAAQRRDKQRQQRQQRLAGSQNNRTQAAQAQARGRGPAQRQSSRRQWLWTGGIVALIAVIIVALIVISRLQQSPGSASVPTLASSQVFNAVTKVDPNVLASVGKGGVQNPLNSVALAPLASSTRRPRRAQMSFRTPQPLLSILVIMVVRFIAVRTSISCRSKPKISNKIYCKLPPQGSRISLIPMMLRPIQVRQGVSRSSILGTAMCL